MICKYEYIIFNRKGQIENELQKVTTYYSNKDKEYILSELPNRSWAAIKLKANSLDLYRQELINTIRKSNLKLLLDESNVSLYWIGFILADGSVDKDLKRLKISLGLKDKDHLLKLATYIEAENNYAINLNYCSLNAQNKDILPLICNKYGIVSNKSYNSPDISKFNTLTSEQLLSLIAGFIDGDGNIQKLTNRNYYNLRIKNHASWLEFLQFIEGFIYELLPENYSRESTCKINTQGYAAQLVISNFTIIRQLQMLVKSLDIPYMKRKWEQF